MAKLDIDMICPGHGKVAGKDLLGKQKRYFEDLRDAGQEGRRRQEVARGDHVEHRHAAGTRSGPE